MEIRLRTQGSVTVLDLAGSLTMGAGEEQLRASITQLLAEGQQHLLINLAAVTAIDSSGIGALIKAFSVVKQAGGKLKLLKPSRLTQQLLSITGLLSVFETFDDEAAALSSF
jgi:anti-sigma B factor antagonist